jgi:hypothetical protein
MASDINSTSSRQRIIREQPDQGFSVRSMNDLAICFFTSSFIGESFSLDPL